MCILLTYKLGSKWSPFQKNIIRQMCLEKGKKFWKSQEKNQGILRGKKCRYPVESTCARRQVFP